LQKKTQQTALSAGVLLCEEVAHLREIIKRTIENFIEKQREERTPASDPAWEKLRADVDYIAMMCDVELEEAIDDEQ